MEVRTSPHVAVLTPRSVFYDDTIWSGGRLVQITRLFAWLVVHVSLLEKRWNQVFDRGFVEESRWHE